MKWWRMILGPGPRQFWREALETYKGDRFRAAIACLVLVSAFSLPFWIHQASVELAYESQPDSHPEVDYSVLGMYLVIIPIMGMVLANYYLVMRPVLRRKERIKDKRGISPNPGGSGNLSILHLDSLVSDDFQQGTGFAEPDDWLLMLDGSLCPWDYPAELCLAGHERDGCECENVDSRVPASGPFNRPGDYLHIQRHSLTDQCGIHAGMGTGCMGIEL